MHRISLNSAKNRLYFIFDGKVDLAEITAMKKEVSQTLKGMKSGFTIISDISKLAPLPEDARLVLQEMMKEIHSKGLKTEVRVVGDAAVTGNQFQRTSRAAGYAATDVKTTEEAEKTVSYILMGYLKPAFA